MPSKKTPKSPKSRPQSTSTLSAPPQASTPALLTTFSPDASFFATVTQAVDRHRLRIYTTAGSGAGDGAQLLADYIVPDARCQSIAWGTLSRSAPTPVDGSASPAASLKKRKKDKKVAQTQEPTPAQESSAVTVVALGLSSGATHLFSPSHGRVMRILSEGAPGSSGEITSVSFSEVDGKTQLWTCAQDGWVRGWDLTSDEDAAPFAKLRPDTKTAVAKLVPRPGADELLVAHHSIKLVQAATDGEQRGSFTGHASAITALTWLGANRFASAAEDDRVVHIWAPTPSGGEGRALAALSLDSPVRHLGVLPASSDADEESTKLLVVTSAGALRLYDVPLDLSTAPNASPKKKRGGALPGLALLSEVRVLPAATAGDAQAAPILDACFVPGAEQDSTLRLARLVRGAKVVFERANLRESSSGAYKPLSTIVRKSAGETAGVLDADDGDAALGGGVARTQRYVEPAGSSAYRTGTNGAQAVGADGMLPSAEDLMGLPDDQAQLDPDSLNEPTLAQRLKGLNVQRSGNAGTGANDEEDEEEEEDDEGRRGKRVAPVGEASLAQTLTQALHSGDSSLLSSCLIHGEPGLVRATVRRLSGPLAVRLLEACVERMARGGVRSRGALGSARARGLVEWVRQTMVCHTGYLMSLPNLVTRLAHLRSTLSSRLAAHERLLALNGRLELVLSQIELRTAYAAEQHQVQAQKQKRGPRAQSAKDKTAQAQGKTWVEGESDDDDEESSEDEGMEVDGEEGDEDEEDEEEGDEVDVEEVDEDDASDDGSVEDIALGADEDASEDDDEEVPTLAGRRRKASRTSGAATDGATSAESEGEEDGDEEMGELEDEDEDDEDEEDEEELDAEGDSDEVDDSEEDDDSESGAQNGFMDLEAESTENEGSEEDEE